MTVALMSVLRLPGLEAASVPPPPKRLQETVHLDQPMSIPRNTFELDAWNGKRGSGEKLNSPATQLNLCLYN